MLEGVGAVTNIFGFNIYIDNVNITVENIVINGRFIETNKKEM